MSDQQPELPGMSDPDSQPRAGPLGYLSALLGIVLLLPGICSLVFAPNLMFTGFKSGGRFDIGLLILWVICLLIGALGVALIR
jgi:hypothetical protein